MKTVKLEFPIQEAVEVLRLLRSESRCLIEQTEFMPDGDIQKRINLILSARERVVTSLEDIADTEDVIADPSQIAMNITGSPYRNVARDSVLSDALNVASGVEVEAPVAMKHGVVLPNNFHTVPNETWVNDDDSWWNEKDDLIPTYIGERR